MVIRGEFMFTENSHLKAIFCTSRTVWKFHDFSITQILREINFGEYRGSKTAIFIQFRGTEFC